MAHTKPHTTPPKFCCWQHAAHRASAWLPLVVPRGVHAATRAASSIAPLPFMVKGHYRQPRRDSSFAGGKPPLPMARITLARAAVLFHLLAGSAYTVRQIYRPADGNSPYHSWAGNLPYATAPRFCLLPYPVDRPSCYQTLPMHESPGRRGCHISCLPSAAKYTHALLTSLPLLLHLENKTEGGPHEEPRGERTGHLCPFLPATQHPCVVPCTMHSL